MLSEASVALSVGETDRPASCAPASRPTLEMPGDVSTTVSASMIDQVPLTQLVPIAFDEKFAAPWAEGAAAIGIMDVAGIDIVQALRESYLPRAVQCLSWSARLVEHFEIGMEGREVPRHVGSKVFREPLRGAMNLRVAVILIRNEQCGDFKPDVSFLQKFQRLEHRCKAGEAKSVVKII